MYYREAITVILSGSAASGFFVKSSILYRLVFIAHNNTYDIKGLKLTGEIKDGKTYFYYDGYVTTLNGERMDYKEVVCDFVLEPEIFNFMLDDQLKPNITTQPIL